MDNSNVWMGSVEWAFAEGGRKAKLANQNVRMRALNCFGERTSVNWHFNGCTSIIALSPGAKKKKL
jgi:hypothetical protein